MSCSNSKNEHTKNEADKEAGETRGGNDRRISLSSKHAKKVEWAGWVG